MLSLHQEGVALFGFIFVATFIGIIAGITMALMEGSYDKAWEEFCKEYNIE